jgi:hypothetical protein
VYCHTAFCLNAAWQHMYAAVHSAVGPYLQLVDVDLCKLDVGILIAELLKNGPNHLAWTTPLQKNT